MAKKLNKSAPTPPKERQRRPRHPVYRLRAWVWMGEIEWRTDDSLRGLDRGLLGDKHGELRAFWRVKRDGFDPGRKRVALGNRSLVEVVAEQPGFDDTKNIYESRLWLEVLGPTEMTKTDRDVLIAELLGTLGLFQPDGTDDFIADEMKLTTPGLRACDEVEFKESSKQLIDRRSVDCILLLCLLYRRAMENAHLEQAIALRDQVYFAVKHYCDRPGFDGRTIGIFLHLINRRVFCGDRNVEPSPQAIAEAKDAMSAWRAKARTRTAHRNVDAMEYLRAIHFSIFDARPLYPLCEVSPDILRYQAEKPRLLKTARKKLRRRTEARFKRAMAEQDQRESDMAENEAN